jgi:hypothetical protein
VSLTLFLFCGFVAILLLLLFWALRGPRTQTKFEVGPGFLEETGGRHISFLPQIRQAFAKTDDEFLSGRGLRALRRRVRRERRAVALAYLSALRGDFQRLLRIARIIAALSPEVAALQEFERFGLTVKFGWRYEMIRMQLRAGLAPIPRLAGLGDLVGGLSVRMETAMTELGERAALAAELASSFNRRGSGVA